MRVEGSPVLEIPQEGPVSSYTIHKQSVGVFIWSVRAFRQQIQGVGAGSIPSYTVLTKRTACKKIAV